MINNFRSHGYTNWLIFNRMGYSSSRPDTVESYSWQTLDDPLGKTIQGGHYYMGQYGTLFSSNIGQRCFNAMNIGYGATGQPLLGTEEGLDWYESTYFTQAEMNQFNSYLQLSFDAGFGNVVWLNHGLSNMAAYEHLNIHFPDAGGWVPPPPVQETLYKLTYSTDGRGVVAVQPQNSSGLYSPGVQVTMTATGYSGYALGNWRVDGASQLPTNPLTFVMDKNHTVLAEFISSGTNPPPVNNATEPILVETYKNHAIYGLATGVFYVDSQSSYTFSTLAAAEQYIDTISPQPPAPTSYLFSILTISIVAAAGVIVFRKRLFGASRLGTFAYRRSCLKPRK
jgi:hypothetical protein